ncbi:MAG TPA: hypothetical protein VFF04_05560, partial [Candidatus Babeliales bacterium]|nr:hypothetical protein [Candidatus Babeliales bacterium]
MSMLIGPLFKTFRVGIVLFYGASRAIFFEHHRYFIFCILLTLIQFMTFTMVGVINPKLLYSILITETLSGLNFFDILFTYIPFSFTCERIGKLFLDALILISNLFMAYFVACAAAYYIWLRTTANATAKFGFKHAYIKINQLFYLALLESGVVFLTALIGAWGNVLYFIWQLLMIFAIQLITFEDLRLMSVIKKSVHFFTNNIKNILGIDTLINFILIMSAVLLYYFYSSFIFAPIKTAVKYNYWLLLVILYILSVVYMLQLIAITNFFSIITK